MLGEDHSLLADFPELEKVINSLLESDEAFANENKRYTLLDNEIRSLEVNGAPIDDEAMHQKKHERAVLKDELYQKLIQNR